MQRDPTADGDHMNRLGPDGPEQRETEIEERLARDWLLLHREEQRADESRNDPFTWEDAP
jgi:hypothetical protein